MATSSKAPHHGSNKQIPSVYKNEEHELEWQGYHKRRKHHHSHGQKDACHNHIDHKKWYVYEKTDLKSGLQFTNHKCGDENRGRYLIQVFGFIGF